MGNSRLPNRIPIPAKIKLQDRVIGFGGISVLISIGAFVSSNGFVGVVAGAIAFGLFWAASKIKTHRTAFAESKVYH